VKEFDSFRNGVLVFFCLHLQFFGDHEDSCWGIRVCPIIFFCKVIGDRMQSILSELEYQNVYFWFICFY
jgi:hypothetical protein